MTRAWPGLVLIALLSLAVQARAAAVGAGKYQMVLGDCKGCHGQNLAGGISLLTPFGRLVTPNITPDKDTGIGTYTAEDFRRAMKSGVAPFNRLLYPAMPYPSYARMSDGDVAALWAYLKTVKPVKNRVIVNRLRFPFNQRFLMRGWNYLFFRPVGEQKAATKTATWRRGAYLVEGPGHCGACHTPKNLFGADKASALSGALVQGWIAPDLTGDRASGLGSWSQADIVAYLQTGRNARSIASGPMAEAVENSTSQMTIGDLKAIAVYLKDLPAIGGEGQAPTASTQMAAGRGLYAIDCAACHGRDGKGSVLFPPLAQNPNVRQGQVDTLVRVVLAGAKGVATAKAPTGPAMPSLAWKLNDRQVADILTYIRNTWGNSASAVSADTVAHIRSALRGGD